MRYIQYLIICCLIIIASPAYAVVHGFEKAVRSLGSMTNTTSGVVDLQKSGYAAGGSFVMRNPAHNVRVMHFDMPSIKAGCGGIDLYMGSFSFITKDQFTNLVKAIPTQAMGYALELGMDVLSPQMGNTIKGLRRELAALNGQNINSCNLAASLVSAPFTRSENARRMACRARSNGSDIMSDYLSSGHDCSKAGDKEIDTKGDKNPDKGLKNQLGAEFNLVFEALKKRGDQQLMNDSAMVSLLMSVSGTFISRLEGDQPVAKYYPSLLNTEANLMSFMQGSEAGVKSKLYKCNDTEKCLHITAAENVIPQNERIFEKVKKLMKDIADKLYQDAKGDSNAVFTAEEKILIELSFLPVLATLETDLTLYRHPDKIPVEIYAKVVAFEMVIGFLNEMLHEVEVAVAELAAHQFTEKNITHFNKNIASIKADLERLRVKHMDSFKILNEHSEMLEYKDKIIQKEIEQTVGR